MKNHFLPTLFLFLFASISIEAQPPVVVDKVVSAIGDRIILHSDVEEQVAYIESQQGVIPEEGRCFILDQLLTQKLLLVQAAKDSVVVTDEEVSQQVEARIQHILRLMNGDEEQFRAYYGMSLSEVREKFNEDMEAQLLTQRMQAQVVQNVSVTPSEVKDYFKRIPVDSLPYFNSEVEIAEIVVKPQISKAELDRAKALIEDIRNKIINEGEDFVQLASIYSDDPGSKGRGGDLGWVRRGELVPEFEAAVFRLDRNEYSKPVRTEYGYHLIQLLERRGNAVNARHILIKPQITQIEKDLALAKLDTIKQLILTDSLTFIKAVRKYSDDEQSKNNAGMMSNPNTGTSIFEISELPHEVYFAVDTLTVGSISNPVEFDDFTGDPTYKILMLRSKTDPHQANLKDDYSKIQRAALEEKKMNYLSEWISTKTDETFIFIDTNYERCEILSKWINP